ncbi:hypothetical protein WJU16_02910 [Chitinophaga pollutisoli]|uniref:ParB-related ThiF-related cassette protein E domain-containing protein n=1 Tax=Chitinophaga pollutisoli TaxID=3133966 RepID=A0ABZ2YQE2_9BACT
MTTNFFSRFEELGLIGEFQLRITVRPGVLRANIIPVGEKKGPDAPAIQPLNLRDATAAELDAGFFAAITRPLQTATGLLTNLEAFEKSAKKACTPKANSATPVKKTETAVPAKYTEALRKSEEQEKKGNIGQAIAAMPDPVKFPTQAKAIAERLTALRQQRPDLASTVAQPCLFNQPAVTDTTPAATDPTNLLSGNAAPENTDTEIPRQQQPQEGTDEEEGEEDGEGEEMPVTTDEDEEEAEESFSYPPDWDEN